MSSTMSPSNRARHVAFLMTFLDLSLLGNSRRSWASLVHAKVRENRVYMRRNRADIYLSLDYVAECSGSASSGWCCPWRETRERISSAQQLPARELGMGLSFPSCFTLTHKVRQHLEDA